MKKVCDIGTYCSVFTAQFKGEGEIVKLAFKKVDGKYPFSIDEDQVVVNVSQETAKKLIHELTGIIEDLG